MIDSISGLLGQAASFRPRDKKRLQSNEVQDYKEITGPADDPHGVLLQGHGLFHHDEDAGFVQLAVVCICSRT